MEGLTVPHRIRRTPPADVGPMILAARERAGLRQVDAARAVGISAPYMRQLETGQRVPSRTVARTLADALALDDTERARLLAVAVDDAGRDWPVSLG